MSPSGTVSSLAKISPLILGFLICVISPARAFVVRRFDMLALTDFQIASHRLQRTASRQLFINHSNPGDQFGSSLASLGDIDNDQHSEFAVTSTNPKSRRVSINIIRVNPTSRADLLSIHPLPHNYIHRTCLTSLALVGHHFDRSSASSHLTTFAIGAPCHPPSGAIFISIIDAHAHPIGDPPCLQPSPGLKDIRFGASMAHVGDIDGDGNPDIVVGAPGGSTVYTVFLGTKGKMLSLVQAYKTKRSHDAFGSAMTPIGDINNDGLMELLIASSHVVSLVYLARSGHILRAIPLRLPPTATRSLARSPALSFVGLDDSDNITFAIGNRYDNDGGTQKGAIWVVSINANGTVLRSVKFSSTQGNFDGNLDRGDHFGASLATAFDVNKDGSAELLVGVPRPVTPLSDIFITRRPPRARPGTLWILDIPGTRSVRVTKLEGISPNNDCVYTSSSCTCSFRHQQSATCLTLAHVTANRSFCRERYCSSSFECGKFISFNFYSCSC